MKTMLQALLAAGLASAIVAQTPNDEALRAKKAALAAADQAKANVQFNGQTYQFVSGQLVSGPPVKGAPYSAEAVNETIQTLADGNRIVQRGSSMQYRDAEGRERREETSAMGVIFITDPVAATSYTLHPDAHTAESSPMTKMVMLSDGTSIGKTFFLYNFELTRTTVGGRGAAPGPKLYASAQAGARAATGSNDSKVEQLGSMFLEGVQVQGTRTTNTIPAGQIGNDRPINIVDESWYSPDLKMTIMTRHSDPRTGDTNFTLKNINRSAPPPTLFEVPSDYTVNAGGGRRGGRGVVIEPAR